MSEINYKEEVLRVYPDAELCEDWFDDDYFYWIAGESEFSYSGAYGTEQAAWESAYNKLKKEGKI